MKTIYNTLTQTPLKDIISLDKFSVVAKLRDPYHLTQLVAAEESENTPPNRITLANIKLAVQAYYDLILELSESSDPSNTLSQYKKQLPANYIPNDSMFNTYLDILDTLDAYIGEKLSNFNELNLENAKHANSITKKMANKNDSIISARNSINEMSTENTPKINNKKMTNKSKIELNSKSITENSQPEKIVETKKGLNMHLESANSNKKSNTDTYKRTVDKPLTIKDNRDSKSSNHDKTSTGLDRFMRESKKIDSDPILNDSSRSKFNTQNPQKHTEHSDNQKPSLQDRITAFLTGK